MTENDSGTHSIVGVVLHFTRAGDLSQMMGDNL